MSFAVVYCHNVSRGVFFCLAYLLVPCLCHSYSKAMLVFYMWCDGSDSDSHVLTLYLYGTTIDIGHATQDLASECSVLAL